MSEPRRRLAADPGRAWMEVGVVPGCRLGRCQAGGRRHGVLQVEAAKRRSPVRWREVGGGGRRHSVEIWRVRRGFRRDAAHGGGFGFWD